MKLLLFALTLIVVVVSGILANITPAPTTPKPTIVNPLQKQGTRGKSVGGYSRRSRRTTSNSQVGKSSNKGSVGGFSRKFRDVSFPNIVDDSELKEASSGFHGVGAQQRRMGRDVAGKTISQQNEIGQHNSVVGLIDTRKRRNVVVNDKDMIRMKRDNSKRASLKKLSTKFHPKKDQSKNKLNTDITARSLGPIRARRA